MIVIRLESKVKEKGCQFFVTSHRKEALHVSDKIFIASYKDRLSTLTELIKDSSQFNTIMMQSQGDENYI